MTGRLIGLLALVAVGAIACSSSGRYSEADVERAFATQGIDLKVGTVGGRTLRKGGDVLLASSSNSYFWVAVIHSNKQARSYYREYTDQKAPGTFDCLKGNVVTFSDEDLDDAHRRQVRAALKALDPKAPAAECISGG